MTAPRFDSARFLTSAPRLADCPPDTGGEVAFAGRSNAGKSSALNCLTRNSKLARTSKTPGRTQLINFFSLSTDGLRLVDLPGYGYAKVNRNMKRDWDRYIGEYLAERRSLKGVVLLMDVRHPMTDFDESLVRWSIETGLPLRVLLTKADKLGRGEAGNTFQRIRNQLQSQAGWLSVQLFSALKKDGVAELEAWLSECLAASDQQM